MSDTKLAVTRQEAADLVSVSFDTIKKAVNAGHLPAKKIGRRYLVKVTDLHRWFDALADA